jgi:hypothetical protein
MDDWQDLYPIFVSYAPFSSRVKKNVRSMVTGLFGAVAGIRTRDRKLGRLVS